MRRFEHYFCLGLFFVGCTAPPNAPTSTSPPRPETTPESVTTYNKGTNATTLRALDGLNGHLISVNERLRFVVIDYSLDVIPALDSRLTVLRNGQPVASLKLTGPIRGSNAAAEIVSGDPKPGDTVVPEIAARNTP